MYKDKNIVPKTFSLKVLTNEDFDIGTLLLIKEKINKMFGCTYYSQVKKNKGSTGQHFFVSIMLRSDYEGEY